MARYRVRVQAKVYFDKYIEVEASSALEAAHEVRGLAEDGVLDGPDPDGFREQKISDHDSGWEEGEGEILLDELNEYYADLIEPDLIEQA